MRKFNDGDTIYIDMETQKYSVIKDLVVVTEVLIEFNKPRVQNGEHSGRTIDANATHSKRRCRQSFMAAVCIASRCLCS
jgi:hypothetical protein